MKKKLDSWSKPIPVPKIAQGMTAAALNARRLADDAALMLKNDRYASAISLAILAIEESGKVPILREMTTAQTDKDWADAWKAYRSHTKKNTLWLLPHLISQGARKIKDFMQLFDGSSDHPYVLDQIKQISIYTDCLGEAHWSVPIEVTDRQLAEDLCKTAELLCPNHEYSELELQLWVKHLAPVWKTSGQERQRGLANWYADMQAHGLSDEDQSILDKFLAD